MDPLFRVRLTALVAGVAMLATAAIGFAQTRPQGGPPLGLMNACKADLDRFCPGTKPGGGRIAACLRKHAAELSQPCRDAALAARASRNTDKSTQ